MSIRTFFERIIWPYRRHKSRTVRYAFPLMYVMAAFLGANVIDSETKSFLTIESSTQSVRAGEMFEIDVYASVHTPVNAVDVSFEFPSDQVRITGIDTGESVITLWTEEPYVEDNVVVLRGGTFRKGFQGRHLIATINAKAEDSGVALFKVQDGTFLAGDGTGDEVKISENDQASTVLYIADTDGVLSVPSEESEGSGVITLRVITDIDGNGDVSLKDISVFMAAWDSRTEVYDFSGDGKMTFRDFAIILAHSFTR